MFTRRHLLRTSALVPIVGLVACAGGTNVLSPDLLKVSTYAKAISDGLTTGLSGLVSLPNLQNILTQVQQGASDLASVASAVAAQSPVQALATGVTGIVNLLAKAGVPIPASVMQLLQAAQVLVSIIMPIVGLIAAPAAGGMSEAEAMLLLKGAAAK